MSASLKKEKKHIPHEMRLTGRLGREVYNQRMEMMGDFYPKIKKEEESAVFGLAHLMNQLVGDMVIEHPVHDVRCVINRFIGPSAAYLISAGRYCEDYLKSIRNYIKKGDKVLNIGAGFGVASVLAAKCTHELVVAVEPYADLHGVILKNAKQNNVEIKTVSGCLVPGELGGTCHFYVDEDVWSSSIYEEVRAERVVHDALEVPIVSISHLLKQYDVDTLLIDAQGGELSLLTEKAFLKSLNKIIVRVHHVFEKREGMARLIREMADVGMQLESMLEKTCVFVRA